jgi:single-stranded-DNA-specific exonuclease
VPETLKAFAAKPYDYADVRAVADGLGLSEPVAVTLVRRGYRTPELARTFLAADESHPPSAFDSMEAIAAQIRAAISAGERVTVHGDFDVDGVCATTIMVSTLRALGAECDWLIPDRIGDGYGVSGANVEKLAKRGTKLLITVDCGVTAVDEVRLARELGIETIVTDHHQADEELPDCPILHPEISNYPFVSLCGTAVAWKLACALREESGPGSHGALSRGVTGDPVPDASHEDEADLDLVALATVADVVPLVGENRALVKRGLAEMRRVRRIGLRALIEAAKCEPTRIDEGDLAFRLAPRINAAGRLYRADAGVELLLTDDEARAEEIAAELGRANSERRAREREVDTAAEAARRELPDHLREGMGLVLAGEDWHPGVVGIVASRLVERHHRPVVVISLDGEGGGRGSGRSIPGFDLHAALGACAEHLDSFGGHRAAAGLSLRAENLEAFREAFTTYAATVLGPEDLRRTERIDAMVGGVGLGLELAEELGQLAPFGMGNPGVRLMVPSARVSDVRTMGEGKHARFSLHSGAHRALGVAFGRSSLGVEDDDPVDAAVRLEVNHWNGSVEPRVVLNEIYPLDDGAAGEATAPLHACDCGEAEWWARFEAERTRDLGAAQGGGWSSLCRIATQARPGDRDRIVLGDDASVTVTIAELVSSGAGVLAVCADASRRAALANGATGLARFNGGAARAACHRCGGAAVVALSARAGGGLALTDYEGLGHASGLAGEFEHVVLIDPPRGPGDRARVTRLPAGTAAGFLHPLWTAAEVEFSAAVLGEQLASRTTVAAVFRSLREAGEASGEELRQALAGSGSQPLGPEAAGRCFRVLAELGLVGGEPSSGAGVVGVVSSEGTDLERSPAFRAYRGDHSEAQTYLERPKQP